MANQSLVLCDTNILIEFYRGNEAILANLKEIGQKNIAISAVTAGELIYGALNKTELIQIRKDVDHLQLLPINKTISSLHLELMAEYSLSHNLTLPDALIAATAISNGIPLFTLNIKDFRFLPELELFFVKSE
jgi:tRNA(fMet)-specific endonuclease VapC